jgi:hypothetical protein
MEEEQAMKKTVMLFWLIHNAVALRTPQVCLTNTKEWISDDPTPKTNKKKRFCVMVNDAPP